MPKGKRGAKSKFTQARKERLIDALSKGCTYELSCSYAGIVFHTFRDWMIKGQSAINQGINNSYTKFFHDIKETEAKAAFLWLDKIDKAMNEQWQAAAWKLERRHPEHYSKDSNLITELIRNINLLAASKGVDLNEGKQQEQEKSEVDSEDAYEKRSIA